ncbi:unnamed protein product [Vicia faba]|uniref:Uncharacterized protein n=1 Tax=Vicia faba TaxID=3906 RepID=A0AAV1BBF8_VICFA|nr:unnamed protein product [Vicia faba]
MVNPTYVSRTYDTQVVRLRIHHQGHLVHNLVKLYVDGLVYEMNWDWDVELMFYMFMEDVRGFKVIDVYVEHKVEEVNIKDVILRRLMATNGEANEKVNEEANVEDSNEESETDPDFNMRSEDDEENYIDELHLGPDVGIGWTIVLLKAATKQPSRLNDISNNDSCDLDELHTLPDDDNGVRTRFDYAFELNF